MAWEDPLRLGRVKLEKRSSSSSFENRAFNFIVKEICSDTGNVVTEHSFELVYKWFGLQENAKLNLCNPIHVGALAIAREVVKCTSKFLLVRRPERLQELADMIINKARKYLFLHCTEDVDYRKPVHFYAVSIAANEILNFRGVDNG